MNTNKGENMSTFKHECEKAIKELESIVRILNNQDKINKAIEEMQLNENQKKILANLFLGELNNV